MGCTKATENIHSSGQKSKFTYKISFIKNHIDTYVDKSTQDHF